MKKFIALLILSLISFRTASFSQEVSEAIYVAPESITITSDGIYIYLNDNLIPVNRIVSDENGFYVDLFEAGRINKCLRCGRTWEQGVHSGVCPHDRLR